MRTFVDIISFEQESFTCLQVGTDTRTVVDNVCFIKVSLHSQTRTEPWLRRPDDRTPLELTGSPLLPLRILPLTSNAFPDMGDALP